MDVTANGLRFDVVEAGQGTPVILLHGFPDTADLWANQLQALAGAGYRAIAPDLRGRGASERPERVEDYALAIIVEDVVGIMDALDVTGAHVVGHDWGAALAWLVAALHPQRVDRLAAISVGYPGASGKPTLEALQKGWYRLLFQFTGVAEELLQRDDWYLLRVLLQSDSLAKRYIPILSQPGALTAGLNWYRANLAPDRMLRPPRRLPPVQAPTLGIFGAHDLYLTEEGMTASERMVQGSWRYERFAESGHWLMLEEPERFNRLLLEFLAG
jgi:pimeloyl-ACP methyl ester carboxylesterase